MGYNYIIDRSCNSWYGSEVCPVSLSNITEDNFSTGDDTYIYTFLRFCISLVIVTLTYFFVCQGNIWSCSIKKEHKCLFDFTLKFHFIYFAIVALILIIHYFTNTVNICEFNYHCDVINGNLDSTKIYYQYINKDCPDNYFPDDILNTYEEYYKPRTSDNCLENEYGCCRYNFQCQFAKNYERRVTGPEARNPVTIFQSYSHGGGYINSNIYKEDINGTNCPTIDDILIKNSLIYNDHIKYKQIILLLIYLFSVVIVDVVIMIRNCRIKRRGAEFTQLEEKTTLRGSA